MYPGFNKYDTYAETKECKKCIYMFLTKKDVPVYIGKAKNFSGSSGRYAHGYRYLVELLLESGYKLYIKKLTEKEWLCVDKAERALIRNHEGTVVNRKK